jgi:hypothetical protein
MADRNSIIEKTKALLAKTTENGCTEEEYLSSLAKARAWIDAYEITDDELQLSREEKAILHHESEADSRDTHQIKWRLSNAIERYCNVRIYRDSSKAGLPSSASNRTSITRNGCSIIWPISSMTNCSSFCLIVWHQRGKNGKKKSVGLSSDVLSALVPV